MQFLRIALLLTCTFDWYMTIFNFSRTKKVPVAESQAFRLYATVIIGNTPMISRGVVPADILCSFLKTQWSRYISSNMELPNQPFEFRPNPSAENWLLNRPSDFYREIKNSMETVVSQGWAVEQTFRGHIKKLNDGGIFN